MIKSEAQKRAVKKYINANYNRLTIRVKKDDYVKIKEYLENNDISLNELFVSSVKEKINQVNDIKEKI